MRVPEPPHRKLVKHYERAGDVRALTFSCYERLPLLTNELWRAMFCESLDRAIERHRYQLTAYVLMPEHVHLVVYPLDEASGIDQLLKAIKRPFSFRIKQLLSQARSPLLDRLTIRQRRNVSTFRFWQEGPGYDRNLTELVTAIAEIDYVHLNPVRRGLVDRAVDWRWSSARWYCNQQDLNETPRLNRLPTEWLNEHSS